MESMLTIVDTGRQIPNQRSHDMIKKARDEFSGATKGRNNGSTKVVRFVDFRKYMAGV